MLTKSSFIASSSKRGNERNSFWLARMNLAMRFDRSKIVGF